MNEIKAKLKVFLESKTFIALVFAWGVINGENALNSVYDTTPPLKWTTIGIIFVFGMIAVPVLLGMQMLFNNQKGMRLGWKAFFVMNFYLLGTGLATLGLSLWQGSFGPPALLPLAMFGGTVLGLVIARSWRPITAP